MRDLTGLGFNTNSPQKNYYKLSERIEDLESKLARVEQDLIEAMVRLNKFKL